MEAYGSPYEAREARLPTLQWPRELPIDGVPKDVVAIVEQYGAWFAECDYPKLFISAEPGAILVGRAREFCRTWRNQQEVTVKGIHFIQEDSPDEIGVALRDFVGGIKRWKANQMKAK
jgi:haloalkane dehalogenase